MERRLAFAIALPILFALRGLQGVGDSYRVPQPPQDPVRALPPIAEPPRTAIERRDLLQDFAPASPIEGFYELHSFAVAGTAIPARGYLAVGRQFLSIHLYAPIDAERPALQSAFRRYRLEGDRLIMTGMLGVANDAEDRFLLEGSGVTRTANWSLVGTELRLQLDGGRALAFQRIE